ncbi:hypothetical protein KIN20_003657 [Parelaphostrongylus tenuis]|uniref:Uncharacterized protein n=1 Tax=Parelaphostrongylus tenuis TaxID=148309 RepID=A0AAD5M0J1_PARTN|nr:hypothetical protein KIN20_003657 [Parelaphostrongylus tenuis]
MTSAEALQSAQNEVMAAYLEALSQVPLTTVSLVSTTVTYSPDEISNCYTGTAIPGGTRIGYLAGGAITQIAIVTGMSATAHLMSVTNYSGTNWYRTLRRLYKNGYGFDTRRYDDDSLQLESSLIRIPEHTQF